jgi:hypothetical protein
MVRAVKKAGNPIFIDDGAAFRDSAPATFSCFDAMVLLPGNQNKIKHAPG